MDTTGEVFAVALGVAAAERAGSELGGAAAGEQLTLSSPAEAKRANGLIR
jgi:hypothetical protein